MGKLFCLMGKSSTGKDHIYKAIIEKLGEKLREVTTYTTRPMRVNEVQGREYNFVTESKMQELKQAGRIIECRTYPTVHGDWHYFTADDGQIRLEEANYIMIGTLEAYMSLKEYYKDAVVPIYIEVEDGERLFRALRRERKQTPPRYEEMCRRFLADNADFSEENLEKAGITRRYINDDFDQCVEEVISSMV